MKVLHELYEPVAAMAVCGDCGCYAEWIHIAYFIDIYRPVDAPPYSGGGCDNIGNLKPGDVEGLGGGDAYGGIAAEWFRQSTVRGISTVGVCQLAVYFV